MVRGFPQEHLQQIADTVLNRIEDSLENLQDSEKDREEVTFVNGKRVMYPRWFLYRDDKEIKGKLRKAFGYLSLIDEKILRSYEMLNLVSQDLLDLMQRIQAASKP